jgi:hypothetical protein
MNDSKDFMEEMAPTKRERLRFDINGCIYKWLGRTDYRLRQREETLAREEPNEKTLMTRESISLSPLNLEKYPQSCMPLRS